MSNDFPFEHFLKNNQKKETGSTILINQQTPPCDQSTTLEEKDNFNEISEIERELKISLSKSINSHQYETYIRNGVELIKFTSNKMTFLCKTQFIKNYIEKALREEFQTSIQELLGSQYELELITNAANKTQALNTTNNLKIKTVSENKFRLDLTETNEDKTNEIESDYIKHLKDEDNNGRLINKEKDFNNFIVGASNNLAYASALAVAQSPGRKYPSLYIHSSSGLGKTHLLHAVANGIQEKFPNTRICLITAREFMKEMISYIRVNNITEFQKKYSERVDVLMIDDIHELKRKTGTQDEFFHIFNELYNNNKQLIFTSDKSPQEIDGIEERVKTRLQWGLVVDIQKPDLETRIAILQEKAKQLDLNISEDIFTLIASSIKSSIRELEGSLLKISAYTSLMNYEIDEDTVRELLSIEKNSSSKTTSIDDLAKISAQYYKIPLADLKSKSKNKEIVRPRHVAMYLSRKLINATLQEIGDYFGGRDHTTIMNGVRKIEVALKKDTALSKDLFEIENRL